MKRENCISIVDKEVVIIGNGPSGILLSYMLSGHLPYVVSATHSDEMLSMRLKPYLERYLHQDDLLHLSAGLEGRSTNPVSLLVDSLLRPNADFGLDATSLVEFRNTGVEIDHVVLGRGPPGGSWHRMDPNILTLSLGGWMSLPGLAFSPYDSERKRAFAHNVAKYYQSYIQEMDLGKYMLSNILVTNVKRPKHKLNPERCLSKGIIDIHKTQSLHRSYCVLKASNHKEKRSRSCKRQRVLNSATTENHQFNTSVPICDDNPLLKPTNNECDMKDKCFNFCFPSLRISNKSTDSNGNWNFVPSFESTLEPIDKVPYTPHCHFCSDSHNWLVEARSLDSGQIIVYRAKNVVLANGAYDLPRRLKFETRKRDPDWLFYDIRSFEMHLDNDCTLKKGCEIDPVVIVGAGLSAADAIIAAKSRNVQVIHVFRGNILGLNKQLPENMYPEYHKVQQMMKQTGSDHKLYTPYAGYTLIDVDHEEHCVILCKENQSRIKIRVSYVAVLIGSRPDLNFLRFGDTEAYKMLPLDSTSSTIDVDFLTHQVKGFENLFALGPLCGDNFVRFIPGGALAITLEMLRRQDN